MGTWHHVTEGAQLSVPTWLAAGEQRGSHTKHGHGTETPVPQGNGTTSHAPARRATGETGALCQFRGVLGVTALTPALHHSF